MNALIISWRRADLKEAQCGHGLCVYAGPRERDSTRLAAFVEGFEWRRGGKEAVVQFAPELVPVEKQQFAAFKAAIEARIRAGDLSSSEIVPGYWGIANA